MINALSSQIGIDLITGKHNSIIEWFNDLWSGLYVMKTNVFNNNGSELIYFNIVDGTNKWIFYSRDNHSNFICNHDTYWLVLEEFNDKFTAGRYTMLY